MRWYNWPTHARAARARRHRPRSAAAPAAEQAPSTRAETTHTTEVTTRIELRHGEPFVRLTVAFDNQSDDHRVRCTSRSPDRATHSHAEGQFAVVDRPLHAEGGFGERPVPTFPAYGWVAAGGLAVLLDHVSEYELVDDGRTLALTLLRSVGLLSRNDNAWREEPAGPQLATPGAQCRGMRTVELGLYLYAGEWHESGLLDAAERYRHPFTHRRGTEPGPGQRPGDPARRRRDRRARSGPEQLPRRRRRRAPNCAWWRSRRSRPRRRVRAAHDDRRHSRHSDAPLAGRHDHRQECIEEIAARTGCQLSPIG